ncbi:replication-relaxation family protein [Bacillus thuringiensis]|uniref:replication-relaxation family protein n=1 Tax=Bacillus thuringiensis TaxID=1428 RepID=UPI002DBF2339|nr:replication-relaxation family protein [Bacillus thuringiensis]MEC2709747.1 replication-relaxation family protein [Bacillus thuringiensis]
MRPRDKEIVKSLQKFRCMSRNQIAKIFFSNLKNPITSANFVLKRLRRENLIEVNEDIQPFVYFPKPSIIKRNSQKMQHYLAIVDFFIELCEIERPSIYEVEKRCNNGNIQPDVYMIWQDDVYFVEIQLSRYSTKVMKKKLNRYVHYFSTEEWRGKILPANNEPYVWIVSRTPYSIHREDLTIIQTSINRFATSQKGKS